VHAFAGRDDELTLLRNLLAGLAAGAGGAVLIEGEQGTGKTALLRQLLGDGDNGADTGVAGFRLGWATSDELGQRIPLLPIRQCLDAAREPGGSGDDGAVSGPVPPGDPVLAETERLLAEVERLCAESPVVLVTEDLQWADDASLLAWQRLARAAGQLPLLLAGTCRPAPGREQVTRLRRDLAASGGTVLSLGPLPTGNPLVPAQLGASAAARLSELPPETLTVLRWAAVLGREFRVTDLEMVTGRSAAELGGSLDQAVAAGVLITAGARLAFRDGPVRHQLYEGVPPARLLHAQAARALAAAGAPREQVAAQLALAPEGAGWVPEWLAGALPVLAYRMPLVADRLLRGVIAALPDGDPGWERLQAGLVMVAFLLGRYDEVQQAGRLLLAHGPDPDRGAEVTWLMAYGLLRSGQPGEALAALEGGLRQPDVSELWLGRLGALRVLMLTMTRRIEEAAEAAEQALAGGERAADPLTTGYVLHALSHVSFVQRDLAAALQRIDRALAVIGNSDQATDLRLMLLANRVAALGLLDRHGEALGAAGQALVIAERTGASRLTVLRSVLAHQHFESGQWDDALAELAPALGADLGAGSSVAHGLAALIAAYRDEGAVAGEHLAAVSEPGGRAAAAASNSHYLLLARAVAAERAGQPEAALAALTACLAPGAAVSMPARHLLFPVLVRLALAVGDEDTAVAAARAAADEAEREPLPVKGAVADHCRGLLTADLAPVLAAAAYHGSAGRPLRRAEALTDAAVLLAGRGGTAPARDWFDEALGLYRGMGARWAVRGAAARLEAYGIRPRQDDGQAPAARGWQSLTPTEAEIARLIADGRSNPEIAAELLLSRNTVRAHVSRILAKFGARSRKEIAAPAPGRT
jgi:DNA-binding CsgD family transcriptional regulator